MHQEQLFRVEDLNAQYMNAHSWNFDLVDVMVNFMRQLGCATVIKSNPHLDVVVNVFCRHG